MSLPKDWIALDYLAEGARYEDPPPCPKVGRSWLVGMVEGDEGHRIYEIPMRASFSEIVRAFRVGSHNCLLRSFDEDEAVELVAQKLDVIQRIAPGRAIFADTAGFKIRFEESVSADDYPLIEALFPEDEWYEAGLESYISSWSGNGHPLAVLRGNNLLHLWWD